ncbi:hypothetical protein GCM10011586_40000 [Silvibacterium dinghuense]|nr:hypothetical protein GCM10011586_40000 [Silvibacterium dinghuense]
MESYGMGSWYVQFSVCIGLDTEFCIKPAQKEIIAPGGFAVAVWAGWLPLYRSSGCSASR